MNNFSKEEDMAILNNLGIGLTHQNIALKSYKITKIPRSANEIAKRIYYLRDIKGINIRENNKSNQLCVHCGKHFHKIDDEG